MSKTTLQDYATRLRSDVASITSSPATSALSLLVSKRVDDLTIDYFGKGASLASVLAGFCCVDRTLVSTDLQTRTVSKAWLLHILRNSVKDWIMDEFSSNCPVITARGDKVTGFITHIVIPALDMQPVVTRLSLSLGDKHAVYLKELERTEKKLLPFGLEAFNVGKFADLEFCARTEVLRLVEGSISRIRIKEAMDKYTGGIRPIEVELINESVVDVMNDEGEKLTEMRTTDNFINATYFLKKAGKRYKTYLIAKENRDFQRSFVCASVERNVEKPIHTQLGIIWMHHRTAQHLWKWCELEDDLDKYLSYIPDDTTDCDVTDSPVFDPLTATEPIILIPIRDNDGKTITYRRSNDGYIDGTALLASMDIKWDQYNSLQCATYAMDDIAYELNVDATSLVHTIICQRRSSTWIHSEIAINCVAHYTKQDPNDIRSRFQLAINTSDIAEKEVFTPVRDIASMKTVTLHRSSDGYVNATLIRNSRTDNVADGSCGLESFKSSTEGRVLTEELETDEETRMQYSNGLFGGAWIHPIYAVAYAKRCGLVLEETDDVNNPFTEILLNVANGTVAMCTRKTDNYVDGSKLCRDVPKEVKLSHFLNKQSTKETIASLEQALHIHPHEIVARSKGNSGVVWLHSRLAVDLAQWCDPKTKSLVTEWYNNLMGVITVEANDVDNVDQGTSGSLKYASNFVESLRGDDGNMITELRTSDGFVNATKMCNSAKIQFADWVKLEGTKKFFSQLAEDMSCMTGYTTTLGDQEVQDADPRREKDMNDNKSNGEQKLQILYPNLIEVIHGGKYPGTWIHPCVAIRLAEKCSVKFSVQTSQVILRYTRGDITTVESQEVANVIATEVKRSDTCTEIVLHKGYPTALGSDIVYYRSDMDNLDIPYHTQSSNVGYILRVGELPTHTLMEWGFTTNFPTRRSAHRTEHPGCQNVMIIDTGTHNSKYLEDSMKRYFRDSHIRVRRPEGTYNIECFTGPKKEDEDEYFDRFQTYVENNFRPILRYITREGSSPIFYNDNTTQQMQLEASSYIDGEKASGLPPWLPIDTSVLVEREKTQQANIHLKQEEERTKQKAMDLEMLKIQMAMKSLD